MPRLLATRGLPACGKTTYARKWVAADPVGRARVNRDDIRAMLNESVFVKGKTEHLVLDVRDAIISTLLRRGVDVICDDTNIPHRTIHDLETIATSYGASFEVVDMRTVPIHECILRDSVRDRGVGEAVIRRMAAGLNTGR